MAVVFQNPAPALPPPRHHAPAELPGPELSPPPARPTATHMQDAASGKLTDALQNSLPQRKNQSFASIQFLPGASIFPSVRPAKKSALQGCSILATREISHQEDQTG